MTGVHTQLYLHFSGFTGLPSPWLVPLVLSVFHDGLVHPIRSAVDLQHDSAIFQLSKIIDKICFEIVNIY